HVFDDDGREDLFANMRPPAPPLCIDHGRHNRNEPTANDMAEDLHRPLLVPLQRHEHAGVECARHRAPRRFFFLRCSPRHSASMAAISSSASGGTPYFSKKASAAANFASRAATSARKADTFPRCRRKESAFRLASVASSSEKLVVLVLPARIKEL